MPEHLRPAETQEVTPFTEVTNLLTSFSRPRAGHQEGLFKIESKRMKTDVQRAGSDFNF